MLDISWTGASAVAFVILYTLPLVAGGGYVFYASIRPVSIPMDAVLGLPWLAGSLLIVAAWLLGPVPLLITGLIHLIRDSRRKWWSAGAWVGTLAAGTALGYVIWRDYGLLFSEYPRDPIEGSALGPSRWVPGAPYWQALFTAGGQLLVGAVMIALIIAAARNKRTAAKDPLAEDRTK